MRLSFFIVDEFYVDIDEVRDWALTLAYDRGQSSEGFLPPGLDDAVADIIKQRVVGSGRPDHGRFRLNGAGAQGGDIQSDPALAWSAVLYMSRPEDCLGGTGFYSNIADGSDGAASIDEAKEILARDGGDATRWEHLFTVPMRYNRLVLYRPEQWHAPAPGFGLVPADQCLQQTFAFAAAG